MTPADDRFWHPRSLRSDGPPLIGMVHLPPLPGAPRGRGGMDTVLDRARADAAALAAGGLDAVLVENYGDAPFHAGSVPPETVAAMARAVAAVRAECGLPVGVNVLRNDARSALGVAVACDAAFIRVNVHTGAMWTDQGLLQGDAASTLRARAALGSPVGILADVLVKHAVPPAGWTLEQAAADTWERGLADALIVTGSGTGQPAEEGAVAAVRRATPGAPVLIGSGVDAERVPAALREADGVIVGSALCRDGRAGGGIDPARVRRLMEAAGRR